MANELSPVAAKQLNMLRKDLHNAGYTELTFDTKRGYISGWLEIERDYEHPAEVTHPEPYNESDIPDDITRLLPHHNCRIAIEESMPRFDEPDRLYVRIVHQSNAA